MFAPPIPNLPEFTDPNRPLAPIAARLTQIAGSTRIDPIDSLTVEVRLAGEVRVIDTWDTGFGSNGGDTAAFEEAFGPHP
jgi:hypothetical protein